MLNIFSKRDFYTNIWISVFRSKRKRDLLYDYLKELEKLMKEFFANQPLPRGLYAIKIAKI